MCFEASDFLFYINCNFLGTTGYLFIIFHHFDERSYSQASSVFWNLCNIQHLEACGS